MACSTQPVFVSKASCKLLVASLEMVFSTKAVFLLLVFSSALCQASSNGDTVTDRIKHGIEDVTNTAENLRLAAERIDLPNAPQEAITIARGFAEIIAKLGHGIEKMNSEASDAVSDADAKLVVKWLRQFVKTHKALLNVVIHKEDLSTMILSSETVRISLLSLEVVMNSFSHDLIALIPTQRSAAEKQFAELQSTLNDALNTYGLGSTESDAALAATTEKIVEGFKVVTDMSNKLRIATENINVFNAAQQGIVIAQGFTTIIGKISEGIVRVDRVTSGPLADIDAQLVVDVLTTFVRVHQNLLNVVIGKHGLIAMVPFFEPIRVTLVQLEIVIDRLALDLIALIPTQKPAATRQFQLLDDTLQKAINTYSVTLTSAESDAALAATTEKIVEGFKVVTDMSNKLRIATENINVFNAAQQGIVIAQGFTTIIGKISEGIVRVDRVTSGPLADIDAQLVVDVLTTFVRVHQNLLNVVIGKHGLIAMVPFFEPIRVTLVQLEIVIDRLALDLIALIPTQKPAATRQFQLLDDTLQKAINTYSVTLTLAESDAALAATTEKIVEGFKVVTDMSNKLRIATENINVFNAAQQGIVIAQGFTTIIGKISEGIVRVDRVTSGPLADIDAQLVVDVLTTFVRVHQNLLNVVIGKHGLIAMVPFFEPIRVTLVQLEIVIDRLALDLIALIPTQKPAATRQFQLLDDTLQKAIKTYSVTLASKSATQKANPIMQKIQQGLVTVTGISDKVIEEMVGKY
ncbi:hypothetical protein MPTK1_4g09460 [Marchantia polymorpha subsp. ruderalis]|nr:hypothetical protein MARPO_0112s0046 [Marchantia polymorpha]BBN08174.1 hypothetical protein Mp_4g09460 [Marchantia polymorpha subsp. ruderalis]|eukprot:PTQ31399.1 hypothetical protein MARPO_0112s0046 [Marchantia polymorpha]